MQETSTIASNAARSRPGGESNPGPCCMAGQPAPADRRPAARDRTDVSFSQSRDRRGARLRPRRDDQPTPRRPIAAARRAFDTTDWSTNIELRIRCLEQFHQALHRAPRGARRAHHRRSRRHARADRRRRSSTSRSRSSRYYAELLKSYPMTEDLGSIESRGHAAPPLGGEGSRRRGRGDHRLQLSEPVGAGQAGARAGRRLHRRAQGRARTPR